MNRYHRGMTKKEFKKEYSKYRNNIRILVKSIMIGEHHPTSEKYWQYARETPLRKKYFFERIYNKRPVNNNSKYCMPKKRSKLYQKGIELQLSPDQYWEYEYIPKKEVYKLTFKHVIKIDIIPQDFKRLFMEVK